ncbi:MAG: complex I subunit 1 family protein [Candidatus Thermoplasmatota archaeon]|nr:complex I subunit 1 family protein [Candidatus Thermoplasmatota archaeon]
MIEEAEVGIKIGIGIAVVLIALVVSLLLKGVDRKFAAWLQARVGPPIRQPIWDTLKLFQKENIIPERAVRWVFNGAPLLAFVASMAILFYLPLGPIELRGAVGHAANDWLTPIFGGYGDLILIIYLLAVPGLMMAIGGFSSGSPLATIGAQREMVMMMSYEFPLAVVILSMAWRLTHVGSVGSALEIRAFVETPIWNQVGILGIFGLLLLAGVFFLIIPSELSKIPFDAPEAETEIGGGIIAEYSGTNLAMFMLADAVKTIAFTSLAVALFFPYNISPVFGAEGWFAFGIDMVFWLIKIEVLYFLAVTVVRVGAARLKIDKLSWLYLVPLSVLSAMGVLLLYLDTIVG